MTAPASFNLIDEPWIRVRTLAGTVEEWSLRTTLAKASEVRGLAGEIPTQDAALLRLLLAIILGATRPRYPRTDRENLALFEDWWSSGTLPMTTLDPYLEKVRDRFDLVHPEAPFYQVAGLSTATGEHSGLAKLIADVPDRIPFFSTRSGAGVASLSLPEAARWLVHCQAFDPAGIKTGALGDNRVKQGKGYSLWDPAWAGTLGLIVLERDSLFETLLLNLPLMMTGPTDLPVWERPPLGPGIDPSHPLPIGPTDCFTWPSRRLRLFIESDQVRDCQVSNGDKLSPQDLHHVEPMSAWKSTKADARVETSHRIPVRHEADQRIWQGLAPLLTTASVAGEAPAHSITWLAHLREAEIMPPDMQVDIRTIGLHYDTNRSKIMGATDDRLTATVAALTDPVLVQAAVDAAAQASQGVTELANLASDLDKAAGEHRDPEVRAQVRKQAFEIGYAILDSHYRAWIRTLDDPTRVANSRAAWESTASELLRTAGDELVADASPSALIGRYLRFTERDKLQLFDAGRAGRRFRFSLAKVFPQPSPTPTR